ncbi:MAG: M23 family metallopeptidase [Desulfovibrio sp.]|jgi:murein DD-endopeptidase MepM/ murein hydrolase activator NlpD|nr:M23 family metallopeptidase [Desulfovibrio sp.]
MKMPVFLRALCLAFLFIQAAGCSAACPRAGLPPPEALRLSPAAADLLASAGRDPSLPQPEPGFSLSAPEAVWAGEPFLLEVAAGGLAAASVSWRGRTIFAAPGGDGREPVQFLLSVPLRQAESSIPLALALTWADGRSEVMRTSLAVLRRDYPEQRLRVARKYVRLTSAQQERVRRDQRQVREAVAGISPVRRWRLPLLRPLPGAVTSVYGLRRFFNGEERNPHRGIDFSAKEGDPVPVCADGRVVLVREHYFGGNTVIVDHGLGVFSLYLHLSAFHVSEGETVRRGQVIGLVGSTGRVTGPHLHFSLAVQGELVDAAPLLEKREEGRAEPGP